MTDPKPTEAKTNQPPPNNNELALQRTELAQQRTGLATQRTGMSTQRTDLAVERNDLAEVRTALARERTRAAEERTLMAWIRTALSMNWRTAQNRGEHLVYCAAGISAGVQPGDHSHSILAGAGRNSPGGDFRSNLRSSAGRSGTGDPFVNCNRHHRPKCRTGPISGSRQRRGTGHSHWLQINSCGLWNWYSPESTREGRASVPSAVGFGQAKERCPSRRLGNVHQT